MANTVGSLTKVQESILIGTLLGDGTMRKKVNIQQFTIDEQKKLIFFLEDQFGLKSTLNKDRIYFRIRVRSESSKKMVKIIEKYVLPSFRYKLPLL